MFDLKKRSTLKAGLLVVASSMMLAACGEKTETKTAAAPTAAPAPAAAPASGPLKVAFVYVGPVGDGGWTFAHDQGRKAVEAAFGDKIQTTFVEKVPES
ncbi:MAG TPA: BMP family ABC transporter substrate-binding protein, partial [Noviherbaspirillum sp.]